MWRSSSRYTETGHSHGEDNQIRVYRMPDGIAAARPGASSRVPHSPNQEPERHSVRPEGSRWGDCKLHNLQEFRRIGSALFNVNPGPSTIRPSSIFLNLQKNL